MSSQSHRSECSCEAYPEDLQSLFLQNQKSQESTAPKVARDGFQQHLVGVEAVEAQQLVVQAEDHHVVLSVEHCLWIQYLGCTTVQGGRVTICSLQVVDLLKCA
jgi:hypothetical protein